MWNFGGKTYDMDLHYLNNHEPATIETPYDRGLVFANPGDWETAMVQVGLDKNCETIPLFGQKVKQLAQICGFTVKNNRRKSTTRCAVWVLVLYNIFQILIYNLVLYQPTWLSIQCHWKSFEDTRRSGER